MAWKVTWSIEASNDLDKIAEYIKRDSENYAKSVVRRILESTHKLQQFPRIGRIVPELGDENFRELLIINYRVIYRIENDEVTIAAIAHTKQSLDIGSL